MMLNINSKSRPLQQQIMSIQPPTQQIACSVQRVLNEIAYDSPESGDRSLISGWGYAELANESAGQVALVCKASLCSGLGGCSAGSKKPSRKAHAPLNKVGMRCNSHLAREASQELEAANA
jgi:hypothetical protein